jgi:aspartate racemase
MKRIGLIGGISWESTRSYYTQLNELTAQRLGAWHQPRVLIDSLDFSEIVALQNDGDWQGSAEILRDSARRLERAGATVLAISANTMHVNYEEVAGSVDIPVLDIRDAIVWELRAMGADSLSLLGTKYLMENDFYSSHLERAQIRVVKPTRSQGEELQAMIFEELTQGIVTETSRATFLEIAEDCRSRGGEVVGLCCTEFGMFFGDEEAPWRFVDSTEAHVKALLNN